MNNNITSILNKSKLIVRVITIVIITVISVITLNIFNQSVKNTAIQGCLESSYIKTVGDKTERMEPSFYVYTLCIKDKGLTTTYSN